jgi:hypothetical protein
MSEIDPYEREAAKAAIKVLQRELAEARKERDKWAYECEANMKLLKEVIATATRAIEQRDTLAEALEMVATYTYADGQCDNGYTPQYVAKQALAAVRGGTP